MYASGDVHSVVVVIIWDKTRKLLFVPRAAPHEIPTEERHIRQVS
jgi:hypothetical protein